LSHSGDGPVSIALVPTLCVGPLTLKTDPLPGFFLSRAKGKLRERLAQAADPADAEFQLLIELHLNWPARWAVWLDRNPSVREELRPRDRRSEAVAIRAEHLALGDLGLDLRPAGAPGNQRRHVGLLVAQVMKLKRHDVSFPAISAGLPREVVDDSVAVLFASRVSVPQQSGLLDIAMFAVIAGVIRGEAGSAPTLNPRFAPPARRKLVERLCHTAARTGLHRHT